MFRVKSYTIASILVYTVVSIDGHGEEHDLSPTAPCQDRADLRSLVTELHAQGAYSTETRDALLSDAGAL